MGERPQSLLFDKSRWTVNAARAWLDGYGYRADGKVDSTGKFHRFRQHAPGGGRFRTVVFGDGIEAVFEYPKGSTMAQRRDSKGRFIKSGKGKSRRSSKRRSSKGKSFRRHATGLGRKVRKTSRKRKAAHKPRKLVRHTRKGTHTFSPK